MRIKWKLTIKVSDGCMENFIDEVAHFILKERGIPTTQTWAEAVAGQILTACVQFPIYTPTKWSPIKGILFNSADVNISPSGVWYKGLLVDAVAMPIISSFMWRYYKKNLELAKKRQENPPKYPDLIMPGMLTSPEAMTDFLWTNPFCIDWKAEITTLFITTRQKQTYRPRIEFYTHLIDGIPIKRRKMRKKDAKGKTDKYRWHLENYR